VAKDQITVRISAAMTLWTQQAIAVVTLAWQATVQESTDPVGCPRSDNRPYLFCHMPRMDCRCGCNACY